MLETESAISLSWIYPKLASFTDIKIFPQVLLSALKNLKSELGGGLPYIYRYDTAKKKKKKKKN